MITYEETKVCLVKPAIFLSRKRLLHLWTSFICLKSCHTGQILNKGKCIRPCHTHTHTHTLLSQSGSITNKDRMLLYHPPQTDTHIQTHTHTHTHTHTLQLCTKDNNPLIRIICCPLK